jgi:hypothetical protein
MGSANKRKPTRPECGRRGGGGGTWTLLSLAGSGSPANSAKPGELGVSRGERSPLLDSTVRPKEVSPGGVGDKYATEIIR